MSEILIVLLLLAPVLLVVLLLNNSRKKAKEKAQEKLSVYLRSIADQAGMKHGFQKLLVHQMVMIDERSRKILLVDRRGQHFSHEQYSLDLIKTVKVVNLKQTIPDEQNKKPDVITTQIGVAIAFEKPEKEILIAFYDHIEHTIFQMAELEKEAWQMQEKFTKARLSQPINT